MILTGYPKRRRPLPEEYARIYAEAYAANRRGATPASSLAQRMESWMHRQVAADVQVAAPTGPTLEVGAGTLNHLPYEPRVGNYDIVEPFRELYEGSPGLARVRRIYADVAEIAPGTSYDRIVSLATLEHICELPQVVGNVASLLSPQGCFRVAIPSEGCLLWRLGWGLTTGVEFRLRYGLDYGVLMRHEHVNTAREIEEVLRYFFADVQARFLGLNRSLSFYQFFNCTAPRASGSA